MNTYDDSMKCDICNLYDFGIQKFYYYNMKVCSNNECLKKLKTFSIIEKDKNNTRQNKQNQRVDILNEPTPPTISNNIIKTKYHDISHVNNEDSMKCDICNLYDYGTRYFSHYNMNVCSNIVCIRQL